MALPYRPCIDSWNYTASVIVSKEAIRDPSIKQRITGIHAASTTTGIKTIS